MLRLDVIGDPIDHSKSPLIHGTALEYLDIPCEYRRVQVKKGELEDYIRQAKADGICGFNLTMPHKIDIIPYLDFGDEDAQRFSSVNTVRIRDKKLYGYNTDGKGFVAAMEEKGFSAFGKNVVFLGAGGVASTLALQMEQSGAKRIAILNRTASAAEKIASTLSIAVRTAALTLENLKSAARDCDILVNATPLGMCGIDKDFEDLSFIGELNPEALVYDLIYNPEETQFLKTARLCGFETLNGMGMLIYQGLLADEIFLERKLDFAPIKEKIQIKLKNLKK